MNGSSNPIRKDPAMMHHIYQLMGLIAPDEPYRGIKIKPELDPLNVLENQCNTSIGATGIFLPKSEFSPQEKNILQ